MLVSGSALAEPTADANVTTAVVVVCDVLRPKHEADFRLTVKARDPAAVRYDVVGAVTETGEFDSDVLPELPLYVVGVPLTDTAIE